MATRILLLLLVLSAFARPSHAIVFGLVHAGSVPTGVGCYDVKTADLNGDGHLDVVSALNDRRGVAVVFGTGSGLGLVTFYPGGVAQAVDLADCDGNGSIDILEADWTENVVRLWKNQGNGMFVEFGAYNSFGNPRDVASGDFNGDGLRDAAVAQNNGQVRILLGVGGGALGLGTLMSLGGQMKGIAAGDLDLDGDLDLVAIDAVGNKLHRLRNDGSLQFTAGAPVALSGSPSDVALADLDGDGTLDAAVSLENGKVAVVKGGAADFVLPVATYPVGNLCQSVQIAEFDQEGGPDLLVSNYSQSTVTVLGNQGGLLFGTIAQGGSGAQPRSAAPGDFDEDGRMDVVSGDFLGGTVTYLRNADAYPHLMYTPSMLDFGEGFQGFPEIRSIQLSNTGAAFLTVTPGAIDGTEFAYPSPPGVIAIPSGESRVVQVRCKRTVVGEANGTLHFSTTDTLASNVAVELVATTIPATPKITYAPSTLDFGTDYEGNQEVLAVEVFNEGHAILTVTPGAIDGTQFSYAGPSNAFNVLIGSSATIPIRYARSAPGGANGTLHLATNDPDTPQVAIGLEGFAGPPPLAGFSAPQSITVPAGSQGQVAVVVRSLGITPLHVTVPADVGDLAEVSPFDVGPTSADFLRFEPSGAVWNIDWEGRVVTGGSGEYANGMDESNFLVQTGGVLGLGGRELRLGPALVAPGITIHRKIYVPEAGGWVRYIDVAENPNANARTATFDLIDNIGYVPIGNVLTSDGNGQFELDDDWIVAPANDRRSVGRVFRGAGSENVPVVASFFASPGVPGSFSRTKYVATVPPHGRVSVIQWAIQGADANEAQATAEALRGDPSMGLLHADAIDRSTAWNLAQDPHPFRPVAGNFVIAPGDSALLSVVLGAEAAMHDADLAAVLRLTTDDPQHLVLEVPLAFSVGNGQVVGTEPGAPTVATLALSGFRPNPLRLSETARVAFRLASSEPATLTLYDVRGRALARQGIDRPQPGPQILALTGAQLAPGVVWMRLEQGGKVATGRGIVLP